MRRLLSKADGALDVTLRWGALAGALATGYFWLARRVPWFADLTWPEMILVAIAMALATLLTTGVATFLFGAGFALYRYFNPLDAPMASPDQPIAAAAQESPAASTLPPKPDLKPDCSLNAVLVRVYRTLGRPPTDEEQRKRYDQRVDREIADTVSLYGMHVWGRLGDRPIAPISQSAWKEGAFSHRAKILTVPRAEDSLEYADLHFCKVEIEQHWLLIER